MSDQHPVPAASMGRITDARGRLVTQMDPVRLHLLEQRCIIPAETLRSMADKILPGARRQRMLQVMTLIVGVVVVVGGNVVYFRYFSFWKGLDPVLLTIYVVQALLLLGGPLIAFWKARRRYIRRVAEVMLAHRHCPHCGYNLRGLPTDPKDHATRCPECGCWWQVPARPDVGKSG